MKKLILVNGDIATGKSHLAIILRDRFNLPLFTKDEYKEELAKSYPYRTYEESHKLSVMAMTMLFDSFEKVAKEDNDVILEANFREQHMEIIEKLTSKYHYQILHLDLVGSPSILYLRYMNRLKSEDRHPVHMVNSLDDYETFEKYTLSRRNERKVGKIITINADDFSYQEDESLFLIIEEFLSK